MRRRRVGTLEVRRDEWEPHEKVVLRGTDAGDTQWILDHAIAGTGTTNLLVLLRGIVSWTLTDEHGMGLAWPAMREEEWEQSKSAAFSARLASLKSLMQEDINFLVTRLNDLNAPNSKEEQEAFFGNMPPGAQAASSMPVVP